ncbi:hypothetical protein [Erwinia piriflorinigrans]|uniref:hypothetical protein n=1 Tax=Erwinia piriflorinigrans TaxID=665097 RepID=UPI000A7F853D|nr:hypothetical protein [Erwinia piriflorinigrans]
MYDISTSGWDVVSITDLDTINKIISNEKKHPTGFFVSDTILGEKILLNGKWGGGCLPGMPAVGKLI